MCNLTVREKKNITEGKEHSSSEKYVKLRSFLGFMHSLWEVEDIQGCDSFKYMTKWPVLWGLSESLPRQ